MAVGNSASPGIVALLESITADYALPGGKTDLARGILGEAEHYQQAGAPAVWRAV